MTLKNCPKCGQKQTTKNTIFKGRDEIALYFNCTQQHDGEECASTFIIRSKNWQAVLARQMSKKKVA